MKLNISIHIGLKVTQQNFCKARVRMKIEFPAQLSSNCKKNYRADLNQKRENINWISAEHFETLDVLIKYV